MEVRSEPTLSCSFAMKSPSGASTSSSSESFGSKLLRLLCRLEAGGPRVVGVEGRIMGSLKSLDGRRSGKVTLLGKGNLFCLATFYRHNCHIVVSFELTDVTCHMPFSHIHKYQELICCQMSTHSDSESYISMYCAVYLQFLCAFNL